MVSKSISNRNGASKTFAYKSQEEFVKLRSDLRPKRSLVNSQ